MHLHVHYRLELDEEDHNSIFGSYRNERLVSRTTVSVLATMPTLRR
jgi:hypothetical protein